MLFQTASSRRRGWRRREVSATALTTTGSVAGPSRPPEMALIAVSRRPRVHGRTRNCHTAKKDAEAVRRRQRCLREPEHEHENQHDEDEDDNQREDDADVSKLQSELHAMYAEVQALQRRRQLLDSALVNSRSNAVTHAMELTKGFYVHFSNGFDPAKHPAACRLAETFLRGVMQQDAVCSEFQGVDLFLKQYKVCTESHRVVRMFVHDIVSINEDALTSQGAVQILAKATARFRVSRATLETLFPSIIADEELTQQLIGKEYSIQYDKVFHFQDGRIFQHESQVDFCTSMLQMAQDPSVATKLLEASLMTKHGHLKVDKGIEEDRHKIGDAVFAD